MILSSEWFGLGKVISDVIYIVSAGVKQARIFYRSVDDPKYLCYRRDSQESVSSLELS